MTETLKVEKITDLADEYQKHIYPNGAHEIQLAETKQAFVAGLYEGMQIGKALPPNGFDRALKEASDFIADKYKSLIKRSIEKTLKGEQK